MPGPDSLGAMTLNLVGILIGALSVVAMYGIAWVVFRDAQERGISESTATLWAVGVAFLLPIAGPLYALTVVRSRRRATTLESTDRWLLWLGGSVASAFVTAAVVTPPDPFMQLLVVLGLLPVFAIGMYLVVFGRRDWIPAG
jgi:Sec-independent protein secretion pathway component TatC